MKILLSSAYWPNLHYFYYVLHAEEVWIEQHEHYEKQSYRNRTRILTANGPIDLCIPVHKKNIKEKMLDLQTSDLQRWQHNHWGAITSAYANSPFFDYFEAEIGAFYDQKFPNLIKFNALQLEQILRMLRVKKKINYTTSYETVPGGLLDMRSAIHPKIGFEKDEKVKEILNKKYYQTFGEKFGFVPNLSVLDLLFNAGKESISYLGL